MSTHTEIDPSDPQGLATFSALYLGVLLFAEAVVSHARAHGALDDEALARIKAQCLFTLKDTCAQGLPIEHEALALNQALAKLEEVLGGLG